MKILKYSLGVLLALALGAGWLSWDYYQRFFRPNLKLQTSSIEIYVHSDWEFAHVIGYLHENLLLTDSASFRWVANYKQYAGNVKPGRYILMDGMNNNQIVNTLRSDNKPINVLVKSVRTQEELIHQCAGALEFEPEDLEQLLSSDGFCQRYGFNTQTIFTLFIPNTYEFYWNTSAEEFMERMAREYKRYWNDERIAKARLIGLSQSQVAVLASIVQAEQAAHPDERPTVAGLYLNRLKKGMRLESDPTLIYAIGDYTIKRVLNIHKEVNSPYNTYRHSGLPPGPILLPQTSSLDAVLNAENHNYIFMCAKADFSGYHEFSSNYRQHVNAAKRYQRELNKQRIYR